MKNFIRTLFSHRHRWHLDNGILNDTLEARRVWHCPCGQLERGWPYKEPYPRLRDISLPCGKVHDLEPSEFDRWHRDSLARLSAAMRAER